MSYFSNIEWINTFPEVRKRLMPANLLAAEYSMDNFI